MYKFKKIMAFTFVLAIIVLSVCFCESVFFTPEAIAAETESAAYEGYIVKLKDDASANVSLMSYNTAEIGDGYYVVDSLDDAELLADQSDIEFIEPNYIVELFAYPTDTNDTYYPNQQTYLNLIGANAAWSKGYDGDGVTVAVVDSGLVNGHEDINYANVLTGTYYYLNATGTRVLEQTGSAATADVTGHGSFVTGVIAAQINNSKGIAGIADEVNILPLKCFVGNETTDAQIIAAIQDAIAAGVDVINMSYGSEYYSQAEEAILQDAADAGIILVAAAGNSGNSVNEYPASYDCVISVGSVGLTGTVSDFSQRNNKICVTAPGEYIESLLYNSTTGYDYPGFGTSYSTPFVTALAAIAKQYDKGIDVYDMKTLLQNSAVDAGTDGYDNSYGYGIINVNNFISELELEVIYNLDDGILDTTAADYVSMFKMSDTPVTLPEPTKEGFNFGGWYTDAGFSGSIVTAIPQGTADDYTVYARWYDDEETTVTDITVKGYTATLEAGTDDTYEVTIPEGTTISASDVVVTRTYQTATVSTPTTSDSGVTWNFTVTSGSNSLNHKHYTINIDINHKPTPITSTLNGAATPASYDGGTLAVAYSADVSSWFSDQEGDTLTYGLVTENAGGNVSLNASILEYTPTIYDAGKDITIVVKANDGMSDSATNVTVKVTVDAIPGSDNIISATSASFDKLTSSSDISLVMSLYGSTLSSVENNGTTLVAGEDYITDNTNVAITKEYLAGLANGNYILIFTLANGYHASLSVIVSDSTVAVTNITLASSKVAPGSQLTLSATVTPANANNQTIVWSLKSAGTTGATLVDNILSTATAGTATVTATIADGVSVGTDYVKDFTITVSSGGGGGGGGGAVIAEDSEYVNLICGNQAFEVPYTIEDNKAIIDIDEDTLDELIADVSGTISIDFSDLDIEEVTIPFDAFAAMNDGLLLKLPTAEIKISADAMAGIVEQARGYDITISAEQVKSSVLTNAQRLAVGDNTVYDLSLKCGSKSVTEFNGSVTVSLPYELKTGEDAGGVVIWYLDSTGNLTEIPCTYDERNKIATFTVTHYSYYFAAYDETIATEITYSDVSSEAWYYDAVMYCSQNGITTGTGNGRYSPDALLTRGQFIVMLMRAYGLAPTENASANFADAGNTYYTDYLAAAKSLGIASGIGNNKFAPDNQITRQDMCVLLYRVLSVLDKLPKDSLGASLMSYTDSNQIAAYAQDAMEVFVANGVISGSGGKLNPQGISTRAQMAQVLYNLLNNAQ